MKHLSLVFLVVLAHHASAEPAANRPSYRALYQPYGHDSYRSRQGQYPSTSYDQGGQLLHLSGGIYRPYDHSDSYAHLSNYYKPYNYDSSYYDEHPPAY